MWTKEYNAPAGHDHVLDEDHSWRYFVEFEPHEMRLRTYESMTQASAQTEIPAEAHGDERRAQ